MPSGGTRAGRSSVLAKAIKSLAILLIAGVGAFVLWLYVSEGPPPLPARLSQSALPPETESGVTFVPGIGPRTYGDCIRILAIDGGGVRGLVPAIILADLEQRTHRPVSAEFDLIVGTSTGSILALGLTRPSDGDARSPALTANDLVELYRNQAARIFPYSFGSLRYLRRIFRPKFDPREVEALYMHYFEDVRLQESLTNVAVPAYDIESNQRIWFQSWSSAQGSLLMRDIVRGATAAPTYFPPARIAYRRHGDVIDYVSLVDGALFANNPSQNALEFGKTIRPEDNPTVLLLSIGTGRSTRKHSFNEAWNWGVLGWMDPLLEIAFSDPAIDGIVSRALEGHGDYYRLQVELGTPPVELDDSSPDALKHLEQATRDFLAAHKQDLDQIVYQLSLPRAPQCGPRIGADYERPDGPRLPESQPTR